MPYLGMIIDSTMSWKPQLQTKKEIQRSIQKKRWVLSTSKFKLRTATHIWKTLFRSRLWWQTLPLTVFSDRIETWAETYLYQSMKCIMNIRKNVSKEKLA